jgi:extracellular factor (EF) 3-hydroxypalmitic acid methyl ester biosynthesis protein
MFNLKDILDTAYDAFSNNGEAYSTTYKTLCKHLAEVRDNSSSEEWKKIIQECRQHKLFNLVQEDILTHRAFIKPRGYAGDAIMMDYVYHGIQNNPITPVGLTVFNAVSTCPTGLGVIERSNLTVQMIDDTARRFQQPNILSVACGHLREASICRSVQNKLIGQYYAADQDADSLSLVEERYKHLNVIATDASVKSILMGKSKFDNIHFVYSLGLYDYLNDKVSQQLTKILFDTLVPGGILFLANYSPACMGRGYMEAFMDWFLIYRDEDQMLQCGNEIDKNKIAMQKVYRNATDELIFLQLKRV